MSTHNPPRWRCVGSMVSYAIRDKLIVYETIINRMHPDRLDEMVQQVDWFAKVDYRILRFLQDHDIKVSPGVLGRNIDRNNDYVGRRCRTLTKAGLLVREDEGIYELSDDGRAFLAGELTPEEIEAMDPNGKSTDD